MAVVMLSVSESRAQGPHAVTRTSRFSVKETMQRIEDTAAARGMSVFARIVPAGSGVRPATPREERLLVLGHAKGVTPVMQAAGDVSIDLPLKLRLRESGEGTTEVTFHDSSWMVEQDGLPGDMKDNVTALPGLLDDALQ
jgi:uncharacterized protein (DUF302 family)